MRLVCSLVFAALLALPITASAQSTSDGVKVKTRLLVLPTMDASTIDYDNLVVQYAVGTPVFGKAKVHETQQACPVKNAVTKEISVKEVQAWQWSMPYTVTDAIIERDATGAIGMVHPRESSGSANGGCLGSKAQAESASSNQAKIAKKENKQRKLALKPNVRPTVKQVLFVEYEPQTVKVFAAEGDGHDYTELVSAQAKAVAAYTAIMEEGVTGASIETLEGLISLWEQEVAHYEPKNKMARINKPVAKGLWMNIIDASIEVSDLDRAQAAAGSLYLLTGTEGDLSRYTPGSVALRIERAGPGRAANPGSWESLHQLAERLEGKKNFKIEVVTIDEVKADLDAFGH